MELLKANFPEFQKLVSENFNILPLLADLRVFAGVHAALFLAFLWAIARLPSRPWTIISWKQLALLVLFVAAIGSSGYAHFTLFQPYLLEEQVPINIANDGDDGEALAGSSSLHKQLRTVRANPAEVFYYVMTVMAVIITHSIMRPWIGSDEAAFGKKTDPWSKSLLVMIGFLISAYYAWMDFQYQSNFGLETRFEEVAVFLLPFLVYVAILFILSVYIVVDGLITVLNSRLTQNTKKKRQ